MPAGRPIKPASLKILEGNRSKREIPVEPQPDPTMPACPDWLSERAKEVWARTADHLHALGLLTSIDGDAFSAYCQCAARWQDAEEVLTKKGMTMKGFNSRGCKVTTPRPEVELARTYLNQMREMLSKFGLSPAARATLGKTGGKKVEADPFTKAMGAG